MKIAVLANLRKDVPLIKEHPPDDEYWDDLDDPSTVKTIVRALKERGHKVRYIAPNLNIIRRLLNYKPDICFNICEGHFGVSREAQVPAILDMMRLPYTGSGVHGMSLSHNKHRAKEVFRWSGLPTPDFMLVPDPHHIPPINIDFPLFVKPAHEGTSIAINENAVVRDQEGLFRQTEWVWSKVHSPVLVEKYIEGREFTVSILGPEVLPAIEIITPIGYYSNRLKEVDPIGVQRVCPAQVPQSKKKEIASIALAAMRALDLNDLCRVDMRMDKNGQLYILEVNPLPLLLPDPQEASFVASAQAAGYSYGEMVNRILEIAAERLAIPLAASRTPQPMLSRPGYRSAQAPSPRSQPGG
jgi:D-alanine-D-alanine ligase